MPEESKHVFYRFPSWMNLRDPIVEHCLCGHHKRSWTLSALIEVFATRGGRQYDLANLLPIRTNDPMKMWKERLARNG